MLAPHDPYEKNPSRRNGQRREFDNEHVLGTDKVGHDYLSRLMYGAQIRYSSGFQAGDLGLIGTAMGVTAGYFGGRVDMVVNFIIDTRLAMPVFLVAMAAVVTWRR